MTPVFIIMINVTRFPQSNKPEYHRHSQKKNRAGSSRKKQTQEDHQETESKDDHLQEDHVSKNVIWAKRRQKWWTFLSKEQFKYRWHSSFEDNNAGYWFSSHTSITTWTHILHDDPWHASDAKFERHYSSRCWVKCVLRLSYKLYLHPHWVHVMSRKWISCFRKFDPPAARKWDQAMSTPMTLLSSSDSIRLPRFLYFFNLLTQRGLKASQTACFILMQVSHVSRIHRL